MGNLIVVIISILLIAITALAGIFYLNGTMSSGTPQIRANMLIDQSHQLLATDTEYMLDKGYSSFNDFLPDTPAIAKYTMGRVPILNFMALSNNSGGSTPLAANTNRHSNCGGGAYVYIPMLDGNLTQIFRSQCQINGNNAIVYWMAANSNNTSCTAGSGLGNVDFSSAANINHPLVQLCLKLNAMTKLPPGLTYAPSGLPYVQGNKQNCSNSGMQYYDGANQYNYCYIMGSDGYFSNLSGVLGEIGLTVVN